MESTAPLRYWLETHGQRLPIRCVSGDESMSAPFSLELEVSGEERLPEPEALLRQVAVVELARDGEVTRRMTGIVTEASVKGAIRGANEMRVVVEPPLALLRHRRDFRVFRDRTVPEIVQELLETIGLRRGAPEGLSRLELRLVDQYAARPYSVQCRESDLDFVHRLLEDEGIHYYFLEHGGMVLGDSPRAYQPMGGLPFRPTGGMHAHAAVTCVARRACMSVGKVALRDFDLARPSLRLDVEAPGPSPGGPELYDYPGEYSEPTAGTRKARLVAEALGCAASGWSGTSTSGRLAPGTTLEIEGSPGARADGSRVVTRIRHRWSRTDDGFSCTFEALDASITYRPPRETPAPVLVNPMTGFVTGPSGEDVHTDSMGRVKVHLPWDRRQPRDDRCSDWIPVLQDNTGHSVGIPRVGWEVLVHFLEGDPDRPVVLGRMYNAADTFPAVLPTGKTKSALKSMTSPGRGGTNQIEIDDAAGSEAVSIVAQRNKVIDVAHDRGTRVLRDRTRQVGQDDAIAIGRDATHWVGGDHSLHVTGAEIRAIGGSRSRSVAGDETSTIAGNRSTTIGGLHLRHVSADDTVSAKRLVEMVGAVDVEASVKSNTESADKLLALTAGGAHIEIAKKDKHESTKYARAATVGGSVSTRALGDHSTQVGKKHLVHVGGALVTSAKANIAISAGKKLAFSAASADLSAAQELTLKVKDSALVLKGGKMTLVTKLLSVVTSASGELAVKALQLGASGVAAQLTGTARAELRRKSLAATRALGNWITDINRRIGPYNFDFGTPPFFPNAEAEAACGDCKKRTEEYGDQLQTELRSVYERLDELDDLRMSLNERREALERADAELAESESRASAAWQAARSEFQGCVASALRGRSMQWPELDQTLAQAEAHVRDARAYMNDVERQFQEMDREKSELESKIRPLDREREKLRFQRDQIDADLLDLGERKRGLESLLVTAKKMKDAQRIRILEAHLRSIGGVMGTKIASMAELSLRCDQLDGQLEPLQDELWEFDENKWLPAFGERSNAELSLDDAEQLVRDIRYTERTWLESLEDEDPNVRAALARCGPSEAEAHAQYLDIKAKREANRRALESLPLDLAEIRRELEPRLAKLDSMHAEFGRLHAAHVACMARHGAIPDPYEESKVKAPH